MCLSLKCWKLLRLNRRGAELLCLVSWHLSCGRRSFFSLSRWRFSFSSPSSRHSKGDCSGVVNSSSSTLRRNKPMKKIFQSRHLQTGNKHVSTNILNRKPRTTLVTFAFPVRVNVHDMWLLGIASSRYDDGRRNVPVDAFSEHFLMCPRFPLK